MPHGLKKGLVQIYTGDGKGKTTAALGLAVRAAGAGLKVCIHQFIKNAPYSEIISMKAIKNVTIKQHGRGCFIKGRPQPRDIECARHGFDQARKTIESGRYDLVILDEVNIALKLGLIDTDTVMDMIRARPLHVEIVLTGRDCPERLLKCADLVTEMRKIRHPFDKKIPARKGIEC